MIYFIGGVGRSGKSTLRSRLCKDYGISGITTDLLTQVFSVADPSFGLNFESPWDVGYKKMQNVLKALATYHPSTHNFVVEGWHITPLNISEYREWSSNNLKMIVLGYASATTTEKIKQIKENPNYNEYTGEFSEHELLKYVTNLIETSKRHKKECLANNVRYIDTSVDFSLALEEATKYLMQDS
ncbi:MAG: hypothetical protein AAGF07_02620 [Patescibacteria group bacterium]